MAQTLFSTLSGEATLDEEDIFQCGKCKDQFTSFTEFFIHKKTAHGTVSLENVSKVDETNDLMYSEIVPDQGFTQPITLTDSEFLSLSMDQGPLNITASPQVLDCCEAYLTTTTTTESTAATAVATDPDQTAFQVPVTVHPEEVILSTNSETLTEEAKEITGTNTITVSVVGAVHDQISSDVRNDGISKDTDITPGGKIKCMYCSKAFTKNYDLQQHVRSHTGERPFQCVVCGRAFSQKSNVKKHMTTHKVWPKRLKTLFSEAVSSTSRIIKETNSKNQTQNSENGNIADQLLTKAYSCQYCPEIFNNYFELKSHRKAHIHQKVYRCIQKNCTEAFSDLDCFLGHTINHQSEAQYHCHVCNKEFKSLDDLGTHQYAHNVPTNKFTPRVVSCKKCKCKFANLEALERHMALDSHTYPCPQCQKVFACERFLRRHLLTHSTVLPYVCEHCNKAFKTVQYLSTHSVIHSNEKPFACQHCPAAFNRSDKLSRHVLIHENLRKYKCPFSKHLGCTKAFNRKDQLKAHMMTHSATLKHSCTGCNHIFRKQAQLKQHEKTCRSFLVKSSLTRTGVIDNSLKHDKDNTEVIHDQNMSTIEIVVVPVKKKIMATNGTIRITCPTATTGNPVDLSQAIIVPDQEVPIVSTNNS